jgi:cytochrome c-type biogenesis protein CcmH
MLAEGREPEAKARPLGEKRLLPLALVVVAGVAIGSTLLYAQIGRPDVAARPASAASGAPASETQAADGPQGHDVAAMISQLEARLKANPNDAEGWNLLGRSYFNTGRYPDAAQAFARAAALDPANSENLSAQAVALTRAADGTVTPQAEALLRKALAVDPKDSIAGVFLAQARYQKGDRKGALDDWIALLRSAPPDAVWTAEVRETALKVAGELGEDISARLPPQPAADAAASGPTPDQVAAASRMSKAEQDRMIQGMVDRLEARLKANPHDAVGWARLLQSRMELNQTDRAVQAYHDAQKALTASEFAQVRDAAKQLGVPGA